MSAAGCEVKSGSRPCQQTVTEDHGTSMDRSDVKSELERRTPSIFVGYRIADRLAAELQRQFGADQVFFDRRARKPESQRCSLYRLGAWCPTGAIS